MPSKVTFDDTHSDDSFSNALEEQLRREEEDGDELEWEDVGRTETVRRTARQTKAKGKSKTVSQEKSKSNDPDVSVATRLTCRKLQSHGCIDERPFRAKGMIAITDILSPLK